MEHFISLFPSALTFALAVILPLSLFVWQKRRDAATGGAIALAFAAAPPLRRGCYGGSGRCRRQGGFTLIELLVCMAILGILAIIVGTVIYFTFFSGRVHISFS